MLYLRYQLKRTVSCSLSEPSYTIFLDGFLTDPVSRDYFGRPSDLAFMPDGCVTSFWCVPFTKARLVFVFVRVARNDALQSIQDEIKNIMTRGRFEKFPPLIPTQLFALDSSLKCMKTWATLYVLTLSEFVWWWSAMKKLCLCTFMTYHSVVSWMRVVLFTKPLPRLVRSSSDLLVLVCKSYCAIAFPWT